MAHTRVSSSIPAKLSFAKIAAMPAPSVTPALPSVIRESKSRPAGNVPQHIQKSDQIASVQSPQSIADAESTQHLEDVTTGVELFSLPKNEVDGVVFPLSRGSGDSVADDQSQLSSSSLKQQSFDTKSMASVTTFAMDEKESIRPDDSASVRAVDEDEIHPGLSRNSSFQQELEPRQNLSKSNVRMLGPNVTITARRYPYITLTNPPRFGDLPVGPEHEPIISEPCPPTEIPGSRLEDTRPRPVPPVVTPDEKLLEALSSPKDRLPLLQLEERIIAFVNNGRELMLELPPQNSFTRLLTHKLADYYNLAHHINDDNSSVRIFRTEYCSLPVSLAEIGRSVPLGSQQMSHAARIKIMRRHQLGPRQFSAGNSTAASSSVPSKATSENGLETTSEEGLLSPIEGTPNRDKSKLTREEREAQYKAVRERIFSDFQEPLTSESGSTGEASTSMSRSSSSSGKKKTRKNNRVPKDDTFEARSSFVPSYAHMQIQPTYQQVYNDMQYPGTYATGAFSPAAFAGAQASNFPTYDPSLGYNNQMNFVSQNPTIYGAMDGWQSQQTPPGSFYNQQAPQNFQQQSIHPSMTAQYPQASPIGVSQAPGWAPSQYQGMYVANMPGTNGSNWPQFNNMQNNVPYQYGQLPPQMHSNIPVANQHPLPGSFAGTKSLFNPQTRSFVPSNSSARGGGRGGRKKGQGSNSGRTSGTSSPAVSNLSENSSIRPKEDSLLQKYRTLGNLPKKPPPSQVSPHFNGDLSGGSGGTPLVANGLTKTTSS